MLGAVSVPDFVINTPLWLALLTTGVGALQGAAIGRSSEAKAAHIDIVGMSVFALFLGLGGGMVRDTMLGNTPFVALRTPWYVVTVLGAVVVMLLVGKWLPVTSTAFVLLDALTLGLYAAIGTQYAIDFDVPFIGCVLVGTAASVAGGVIVAILRNQIPAIIVAGPPYAVLSVGASLIYLVLHDIDGGIASFSAVAFVVVMRFVTLRLGIKTPVAARPLTLTTTTSAAPAGTPGPDTTTSTGTTSTQPTAD